VMGNPLFLAFEKAVQGMEVGAEALVSASGGRAILPLPCSAQHECLVPESISRHDGREGLHCQTVVRATADRGEAARRPKGSPTWQTRRLCVTPWRILE